MNIMLLLFVQWKLLSWLILIICFPVVYLAFKKKISVYLLNKTTNILIVVTFLQLANTIFFYFYGSNFTQMYFETGLAMMVLTIVNYGSKVLADRMFSLTVKNIIAEVVSKHKK